MKIFGWHSPHEVALLRKAAREAAAALYHQNEKLRQAENAAEVLRNDVRRLQIGSKSSFSTPNGTMDALIAELRARNMRVHELEAALQKLTDACRAAGVEPGGDIHESRI